MSKTMGHSFENNRDLTEKEIKQLKEERLQKKIEKKRRKGFEIPRVGKQGMKREQQFQDIWNDYGKTEKKEYNVKGRLDFTSKEDEETRELKRPKVRVPRKRTRPTRNREERDFKNTAQRTPNSGATWHTKGDVKLSHALAEVKERGSVNGRGEKTISIPKEWLTKQADEAFQERRDYWYLAFAYKGDEEIYLIKPYNHEVEMVHKYEGLKEDYEKLLADYNKLKGSE